MRRDATASAAGRARLAVVASFVVASLSCLLLSTASVAASAADIGAPAGKSEEAGSAALHTQLVKTGLYMISGGGGNSVLRLSPEGLVLVDSKLPGHYAALMKQVRGINKMSDLPLRVLIVTDHQQTHAGNVPRFLAAGVPVIAQANSGLSAPKADPAAPANAKSGAPVVTFADDYHLDMGGIEIRILHVGEGPANDDAVVYFPDLKVVAVGDLYRPGEPAAASPHDAGVGPWSAALDRVLALDFEIALASDGPPLTRAELQAFRQKLVASGPAAGATLAKSAP